jgi:lysine 2,3-aminomutase
MRIDAQLCACLKKHRPLWINTQFNHPREITPEAIAACRRLQEAGLPVSNQAVLLRGVNDSFAVLAQLCNELQRIMVRPYYVFQCDGVRGTRHFNVPLSKAVKLSQRLRSFLGGLSMPLFVADIPGKKSKVPLELVSNLIMTDLAEARLAASEADIKAGRVHRGSSATLMAELRKDA